MKRTNEFHATNPSYFPVFERRDLITMLPTEITQIIFSNLGNIDLKSAYRVSKSWIKITEETAICNISEIATLTKHFNSLLYLNESIALQKLNDSLEQLTPLLKNNFTLNKFFKTRDQFKDSLVLLLSTLLKDDIVKSLEIIRSTHTLIYFEPIFNLFILDIKLKELLKEEDKIINSDMLISIALDLTYLIAMTDNPGTTQLNGMPTKTELTYYHMLISDGLEKFNTQLPIKMITKTLVLHGEPDLALSYLAHIEKKEDKDSLCEHLSTILMRRGQTEMALKIASEINDFNRRYHLETIILSETQKS